MIETSWPWSRRSCPLAVLVWNFEQVTAFLGRVTGGE